MNDEKVDRRVQRTRQLIRDALMELMLEKSYEKITIQDIIDRANIGRATFYNHYQDKDDLLLRGVANLAKDEEIQSPDDHEVVEKRPYPNIIQTAGMFAHSQQNQRLHQVMFKRSRENFILEQVSKILHERVEKQLKPHFEDDTGSIVPMPILTQFMAGGLLSLINWWHEQNFPYSPEEMDTFFQHMMTPGILEIVEGQDL